MIGGLRGTLVSRKLPQIEIEVQGITYEVSVSLSTFERLPGVGETVKLATHFVVREDAQLLYGFISEQERRLFRQLIKAQRVGPKLALAILSGTEPAVFIQSVQMGDAAMLGRIPGVGPKTAERLIMELRDKLGAFETQNTESDDPSSATPSSSISGEATQALIALGYKPQEATKLIHKIPDPEQFAVEELIRKALKGVEA